jgi:hypothetical protein
MNGNQLSGILQGQGRWLFDIAESAEYRVQIGQRRSDIVVEMGETVKGLGLGIAF